MKKNITMNEAIEKAKDILNKRYITKEVATKALQIYVEGLKK